MNLVFTAGQENGIVIDQAGVKVVFDPSQQATFNAMLLELYRQLQVLGYGRPDHVQEFARGIVADNTLWTAKGRWAGKHFERTFE